MSTVITETDTSVTGSVGSSLPVVDTAKCEDVIKEEEEEVHGNGCAKPLEGLHEMGPAPFVRKTFEMVDDAETDPVVSWSPARASFIVWDSYKLSDHLLSKYFKHNNFSSFLRQLNTYGFKKVDSDKLEFSHEGFQGGKKHLLKNIKRRSKVRTNKDLSSSTTGLESKIEVESLKKEHSSMRLEMLNLNQRQEESGHQMITVQDKIDGVECKLQHMTSFFEELSKDQSFVERLKRKMRLRKQRELLETTEFVKKLKLLYDQETREKLPCVESDPMTATQPNPKANTTMKCMLSTEAFLNDGFIGGSKTMCCRCKYGQNS